MNQIWIEKQVDASKDREGSEGPSLQAIDAFMQGESQMMPVNTKVLQ